MNTAQHVGLLLLGIFTSYSMTASAATLEQASPSVLWVKGDRPSAAVLGVIVTAGGSSS